MKCCCADLYRPPNDRALASQVSSTVYEMWYTSVLRELDSTKSSFGKQANLAKPNQAYYRHSHVSYGPLSLEISSFMHSIILVNKAAAVE